MGKKSLLDCTLRDGGYLNDWEFGHDNLINIFERSVDAGVDVIEIGFLDDRRGFDIDRSIMPDTDSVGKIYGGLDRKSSLVVGMIDFGTCGLEHIGPAEDSFLDGIRVIFKKHKRRDAMEFCRALKAKGYKVFAQLVAVTSYSREEMDDLIELANDVEPYAVSMVDTYGLMHQNNLLQYFEQLNAGLKPGIALGYHGHNNFQMGYANCIAMIDNHIDRDLFVDATLYGMGKSAGNAPIELVAMHMNDALGKSYNITQMLEAIDTSIMQFYKQPTWGYNMFYFIAAYSDCHPNYVKYLMNKQTLSISSILAILGRLEGDRKLLYDQDLIESLYAGYQTNDICDDAAIEGLGKVFGGRPVLFIGPGRSACEEISKIAAYADEKKEEDIAVVSVNDIPDGISPDYIFVTNSKRYLQLASRLSCGSYRVIATSNVMPVKADAFEYVVNYSGLIDTDAEIIDNSLCMFLRLLGRVGASKAVLAGFDGYSSSEPNYYSMDKEYDFVKNKADYLNSYTKSFLNEIKDKLDVSFLTRSHYED